MEEVQELLSYASLMKSTRQVFATLLATPGTMPMVPFVGESALQASQIAALCVLMAKNSALMK
jgi:hypothetical protein